MAAPESYQGQMLTFTPGEPVLHVAILEASRSKAASYVYAIEGVSGWHVSDSKPLELAPAYFRVACNLIHVRAADGQEMRFGRIERGQIIQDGTGKINVTPQRRRR